MNKILKTTLFALFTSVCVGCEDFKIGSAFLEKPLADNVNIDTVFAHKKYADQLLNQVYRTLPDYMPLEHGSYRGSSMLVDTFTDICYRTSTGYTNGGLSASWDKGFPFMLNCQGQSIGNSLYGIRKAYIYLENVDRVPDMSEEEKVRRKAEVNVIIALHYLQMFRFYGGLPWIDRAYTSDDAFEFPRMTVEETVNKIVTLLDEAAAVLPWYAAPEEEGHMTAAAAKAFKLRVLLFAASPMLNNEQPYALGEAADKKLSWYGDYKQERWEAALEAGLDFLRLNQSNGNYHKIINTGNPREDYINGYWTRGSEEIIISSHRWAVYDMSFKSIDRGHNDGPTGTRASYADMFQWKEDGSDFDWENPSHIAHPFFDENMNPTRDIRLYETLIINQDKYQNQPEGAECYVTGRQSKDNRLFNQSSKYGYTIRKFVRDKGEEMKNKPYQCPLIRMPEIYLSIAEAMNQLGKAKIKDEFGYDAYDYINMVRHRAGMPDVKEVEGKELIDVLLHERAVEFGAEDVRYFDLIRWKRADLLSTPVETLVIKKGKNDTNGKPTFTYERTTTDEKYTWKNHWYLIAFSLDEINKQYGLVQNPGWE